eukprot:2604340-Pyramimonas_sp.AAC.1
MASTEVTGGISGSCFFSGPEGPIVPNIVRRRPQRPHKEAGNGPRGPPDGPRGPPNGPRGPLRRPKGPKT